MAFLDKLNDLAKNIGDKTNDVIETTKLNNKISSERSAITELMKQIGEFYYGKYVAGEQPLPEIAEICTAIDDHNQAISKAQAEIEKIKSDSIGTASVTSAAPTGINCPSCGAANTLGVKFCQQCGTKLETAAAKICPNCKAQVAPDVKFCNECGTKVE